MTVRAGLLGSLVGLAVLLPAAAASAAVPACSIAPIVYAGSDVVTGELRDLRREALATCEVLRSGLLDIRDADALTTAAADARLATLHADLQTIAGNGSTAGTAIYTRPATDAATAVVTYDDATRAFLNSNDSAIIAAIYVLAGCLLATVAGGVFLHRVLA